MKKRSDRQLLQAWSRDRCERSFRALTERYADLVFGTAARRAADRSLAEEVSQNVFISLAKKAGQLKGENGIGGWLFKATVLEAAGIRRSESRRDKRMRELTELEATLRSVGGESMAGDALEIVDDGLAGLNADDRDVLIARFFNGASYEEMAQDAGRSESACRKQVSRALRKLAEVLEGRGVRVSTTVLAVGLGALMCTKAPAGLAGTCARGAITAAGGAVAPGILTLVQRRKNIYTADFVRGGNFAGARVVISRSFSPISALLLGRWSRPTPSSRLELEEKSSRSCIVISPTMH